MKSKEMFLCPRCEKVFKDAGFRLVCVVPEKGELIRPEKCGKCGKKRYGTRFEVRHDI